jgi:hypothetical protein
MGPRDWFDVRRTSQGDAAWVRMSEAETRIARLEAERDETELILKRASLECSYQVYDYEAWKEFLKKQVKGESFE